MDAAELAKLIVRANPTLDAERAAIAAGTWEAYLTARVPEPSRLRAIQHARWDDAYRFALGIGCTRRSRRAFVFPIWHLENEDDGSSTEWTRALVISFEDGSYHLEANTDLGDEIVMAVVEEAKVGVLIESKDFAPGVAMPYRNDTYGALESRRIEAVTSVERTFDLAPVPRPTRPVPAFSTTAELAVVTATLDPAIRSYLDRVVAGLRFTPS